MTSVLAYLREFHFPSVLFRLFLAALAGVAIGYGRSRKQRNAGMRTYILTCTGAALTIIISLYEYEMLYGPWLYAAEFAELKFDGSRFSAQVITGIGFLAAGTIIGVEHQQVSGLTSAIGLFASACVGIAAGAGFYECVVIASILIIVTMESMQPLELIYKRRIRNTTIYIEFDAPGDIETIRETVHGRGAQVFDIDLEPENGDGPSVIMTLKLNKRLSSHSAMLSSIAELPCVHSVRELIS